MDNITAADNLIRKALQETDLRKAHFLLDAAYRLDSTVPVDCYKETCTNKWLISESNKRPADRKDVGFIL